MDKILVIDDQKSVRRCIVDVFNHAGYEVAEAENGVVGIQMAQQYLPDLVISDVTMPELDGYGVLKQLRDNSETATIPLIFLTAWSDRENLRRGMELGADDYLTKPFMVSELLATARTQIEKRNQLIARSEERLELLRGNIALALPHELRTPLTSILGFAEILMGDDQLLDVKQVKELAEHIHGGAIRLNRLIQNYVTYAQIEVLRQDGSRVEALRTRQTHTPKIIIEGWAERKALEYNRQEDLLLEVADAVEVWIGEEFLNKIVEEVADNAFKFSEPRTPVYISADVNTDNYTLRISDRGRGMTPQQIANIGAYMQFERPVHEQQGSGLGLIIAKRLAELHGGELLVYSTYGESTTVTLVLGRGIRPPQA